MRFLFLPLGKRFIFIVIPTARFLYHLFSPLQNSHLSFYFIANRLLYRLERIKIFYFHLPSLVVGCWVLGVWCYTNIRFHPHLPFFHVGVGHFEVTQKQLQLARKISGFFR